MKPHLLRTHLVCSCLNGSFEHFACFYVALCSFSSACVFTASSDTELETQRDYSPDLVIGKYSSKSESAKNPTTLLIHRLTVLEFPGGRSDLSCGRDLFDRHL